MNHRMAQVTGTADHSELAGPLRTPLTSPQRVRLVRPSGSVPVIESFLGVFTPVVAACVIVFLFHPAHWPSPPSDGTATDTALFWVKVFMVVAGFIVALLGLVNFYVLGRATPRVRDPIPMTPQPDKRVAFLATFVPASEDIAALRRTIEGMAAQTYAAQGTVDAWVLDEGDDPEVKALCDELGAHHFTRKGIAGWNTESGQHARRTKHGNINAFLALEETARRYDFVAGVDPDHVPHPRFVERMLGYFRDRRIGYVVGPQTYGNARHNLVARLAESCQFVFHSLLQRAANPSGSPLFVGTNYVFRMQAMRQIGGIQASITEDALTGLKLNAAGWRGVYTPDELAVGEGPEPWGDFYTQQYRWARGTNDIIAKDWRAFLRLRPGQFVHYVLLMSYYPAVGIAWPLGVASCALYGLTGVAGLTVPIGLWIALYLDAITFQAVLFLWARRLNVSANEPAGSSGLGGLVMATMAAPVYAKALWDTLLRRPVRFVVTPKGAAAQRDRLNVFVHHYAWALAAGLPLLAAIALRHTAPAMLTWSVLTLGACLAPVGLCLAISRREESRDASAPVRALERKG